MTGLTRSKIAYDLSISPHRLKQVYEGSEIEYVFSSDLYKRKFKEKQHEYRQEIKRSLSNRFGFEIEFPLLSDLRLYKNIEKRGFLIYKDGEQIWQNDQVVLDGERLMKKS